MKPSEEGIIGTRPPQDLGPLFAQSDGSDKRHLPHEVRAVRLRGEPRPEREFAKRALFPRVVELASSSRHADPPGFTADDVREIALELQLGTGEERDQRAWSWLGPWLFVLARRGVIAVLLDGEHRPITRPSERQRAHGNDQIVYTAADAARAAA